MRSHTVFRPTAAVFAAALAAVTLAGPILAGTPTYRPDGLIQYQKACWPAGYGGPAGCNTKSPGPLVGGNIYNTTGVGQTAKEYWYTGGFGPLWYFYALTIQNDGSTSDRYKLRATGSGDKVKYLRGATDITSAVVAGTYGTSSVASGASTSITVKVYFTLTPALPTSRLVTITSVGDATKKDAVKILVTLGSCGC